MVHHTRRKYGLVEKAIVSRNSDIMLYTIGRTESYIEALAEAEEDGKPLYKVGKFGKFNSDPTYQGGYAFLSMADAQEYIDDGSLERDFMTEGHKIDKYDFSIFSIEATTDDIKMHESGRYGCLLNDAKLISRVCFPAHRKGDVT